ncbi:hypothetical protein BJ944DRAFT_272057 [Cunninghamella echinulata]|nr:hypothetical protein BJ944DRAFT_272057 [Cunninghamella echinulata]
MSTTATATTTSATSFELSRRSKQISYAYSVIDLSFIESVQTVRTNPINLPACSSSPTSSSPTYTNPIRNFSTSSNSSSSSFSIQDIHELNKRRKRLFELKLNDNTCIQFEATNAQAMFEWVHRLRKIIKYGHQCRLNGIIMSQAISNLWYCHIHKSILQSSILYVRKGSQKTYRRYLCVLSKGQGLMLYRYNKQHTMMTKKRMIRLNNKTTYAFGLNHALDLKSADGPTYMMTVDGERTRDQVHQCAFVIWQRSSFASDYSNYHYYITQIKEHVSLLKLGHRLGRKGDSFIFLASTVEEKDAWLWALHHEIDSSFSTSSSSPSSSTYH